MFECSICGLLSLNAISCPACGSQNLKDLSATDSQNDDLPTEIPGLDDAAESWHDLEGSANDENDSGDSSHEPNNRSSLPFGFAGESNFHVSRLPFGIGSHAEGIPFDNDPNQDSVIEVEQVHVIDEQSDSKPVTDSSETSLNGDEQEIQSFESEEQLAEVVIKRNNPIRIQPLSEQSEAIIPSYDNLPSDFDIPSNGGKGFHLKAVANDADISTHGIGIANNGGGTDGQEITLPAISVSSGDDILLVRDSIAMDSYMGSCMSEFEHVIVIGASINQNGDDAIELFVNGTVVETYGDINVDGNGEDWMSECRQKRQG